MGSRDLLVGTPSNLQNYHIFCPQFRNYEQADRVTKYVLCLWRPWYDCSINSGIIAEVWPHIHSVHSVFCTNNPSVNKVQMFSQQLINSFEIILPGQVDYK
jgi:hypothetical protein